MLARTVRGKPGSRLVQVSPAFPCAVLLVLALNAPAVPAHGEGPRHAYDLHATLRPASHVVEGRGRIVWTNESDRPVDALYLHLYLNAFRSDDTVFMRESDGALRGVPARGHGAIEVRELRLVDGASLLDGAETELVEDDRTQMRAPLPEPVAPGERLVLETRFRAELPPLFARSGWVRDFHMVGQWFPKLARLEPDGEWASFPYHGNGEFYADFARYEVTVRTPSGWRVGATGRLAEARHEGDHVVRRFVAERVHDVAFAAWPHFRRTRVHAGDTEVEVLHPPGYGPAVARHIDVVRAGLRHYGRLYGPYPYPTLTVIVPPRGAAGAAGMEYPMLFVTGGAWFPVPGIRLGRQALYTAHELAHQWFQGLVATHEVRWPMLDEGLTEWACWDLLGRLYGRRSSAADLGPLHVDGFELLRLAAFRLGPEPPPPGRPAYEYEGVAYGRAVYARTAVTLETIARTWGRARFERALGRYARAHRFGHPDPEDLFAAFDAVYGEGFSDRVLRPALMKGRHAAVRVDSLETSRSRGRTRTRVVGVREGRLPIPTSLSLVHDGARLRRTRWPGARRRLAIIHRGPPASARANPDRANLLDRNTLDDGRASPHRGTRRALFARLLRWIQSLWGLVGP